MQVATINRFAGIPKPTIYFGKNPYSEYYTDFLKNKVVKDNPLDEKALALIYQLELIEKTSFSKLDRMMGAKKPHELLSLKLMDSPFVQYFPGNTIFVKELRQLLVASGKIPRFVQWLNPRTYKLDEAHRKMKRNGNEATQRLGALRGAVADITGIKANA